MDKQTSQKWLDRLYTVRDFFVGWKFQKMTLEDFKKYAKTPWKLWLFWMLGMRYIFDDKDYAQSPDETWKRRGGDCEDMARFCRDKLVALGYEAVLFRAEWNEINDQGIKAHITCIFHLDGVIENKWRYMGTGPNEYRLGGLSLLEIAKRMVGSQKLVEYGTMEVRPKDHKLFYVEKWRV